MNESTKETVREFVRRINAQDVEGLLQMMTADHVFIDAAGRVTPTEEMRQAWEGYFKMDPEYVIQIGEMIAEEDTVVILGRSKGYYVKDGERQPPYDEPTVWKAVVRGSKLSLWQVFAYGPG